jgi:two-component system response regulator HupR/HoxA
VTIHLPALRDRRVDIPVIARMLLDKAQQQLGKRVKGFSAEALACLTAYHWPGNVRELQNEIQQALVMAPDNREVGADILSPRILRATPTDDGEDLDVIGSLDGTLRERIELVEARIIRETLIRHRWNKSRAAKELGLSRVGLRSKLERYGLEKVEGLDAEGHRKIAS